MVCEGADVSHRLAGLLAVCLGVEVPYAAPVSAVDPDSSINPLTGYSIPLDRAADSDRCERC